MNDDMDLDDWLAKAAATPVVPSAALTARILADADALQPTGRRKSHRFARAVASWLGWSTLPKAWAVGVLWRACRSPGWLVCFWGWLTQAR